MRDYRQISKELNDDLLDNNKINEAIDYVKTMYNNAEGEDMAYFVLNHTNSTQELIDVTLEYYLKSKTKYNTGSWIHSLTHFTEHLWKHEPSRLDDWIKKYNKICFELSTEYNNVFCSDRLITDFIRYAKWDDDPVNFHITKENTTWFNWENKFYKKLKKRIELSPFKSEDDFLKFEEEYPKQ